MTTTRIIEHQDKIGVPVGAKYGSGEEDRGEGEERPAADRRHQVAVGEGLARCRHPLYSDLY